jgi:hypothetical protein
MTDITPDDLVIRTLRADDQEALVRIDAGIVGCVRAGLSGADRAPYVDSDPLMLPIVLRR